MKFFQLNMRKLFLITFFSFLFQLPFRNLVMLGQSRDIKSETINVKEFIQLKLSLSQRISKCFIPPKQLPNNERSKANVDESILDIVGEKLLISYPDYICLIDQSKILFVLDDSISKNKLDLEINRLELETSPERYYFAGKYTSPSEIVVENLGSNKFKFILRSLIDGQRPYEDYVFYDVPKSVVGGGKIGQLRNINKGIQFLGCDQLGRCSIRQYIDSSTVCNFNNLDKNGNLICVGKGSYRKSTWTSSLPEVDKKYVAGKVARYIIKNQ